MLGAELSLHAGEDLGLEVSFLLGFDAGAMAGKSGFDEGAPGASGASRLFSGAEGGDGGVVVGVVDGGGGGGLVLGEEGAEEHL